MPRDIGHSRCLIPGCGATVPIRENRSGGLYYKCLGYADSKRCGAEVRFGADYAKQLRAHLETISDDDETDESAGRKTAAGAPPAEDVDDDGRDAAGSGDGPDDDASGGTGTDRDDNLKYGFF